MDGYLGEFDVDISTTPYANHTPSDWAMEWIGRYGQIDGAHHKAWVLDQVARILHGTQVIVKEARWTNGESEYRLQLADPTPEYNAWVDEMRGEYDEEYEEYEYEFEDADF